MARLPYLDREDLPELERDIFDDLLNQRGSIGNIFRIVAHSPPVLLSVLVLAREREIQPWPMRLMTV